jgi:phospholipid/cholesterol/gamma-HCH transport system substrate-binding protein
VYLIPGKAATVLAGGSEIKKTSRVVDLGELFNRLGPIVTSLDSQQINDFLDTVSQALDGQQDKVGKAIDDLAILTKGLATRDQSLNHLIANLNTVAGTIANRDQQIRVMLDNLVLISSTFSANTQTLDTALQEFGTFSTNLRAILTNNRSEIDRLIDNLDLIASDVLSPELQTLDSALKGVDEAAKHTFLSARLGEWLNEAILCAAVGPPDGTCNAAQNKSLEPADFGSHASSNGAGVQAMQNFLLGPAQ